MIVNLVLFSGIYYVKMAHPDSDFLKLNPYNDSTKHALLDNDDYDVDGDRFDEPMSDNATQSVPTFDRKSSIASESHVENIEKVRTLSFV